MTAYYNEIDPFAAQWLRNLINAGHIAPGYVDERSIENVYPSDLRGFTQCHFFAGIGVWSHALRNAGWADDRPVWTGSCPCQPFSAAGAGAGFADERHLWPAFHHLVKECSPAIVIGEQVASKAAEPWIDALQIDMEALGYGVAAIAFPAAGVGAPHIRDRLYWVADAMRIGQPRPRLMGQPGNSAAGANRQVDRVVNAGGGSGLADANSGGCQSGRERCASLGYGQAAGTNCGACRMDNAKCQRLSQRWSRDYSRHDRQLAGPAVQGSARPGPTNGMWADADWLLCRDGKWRPAEPGTFPLAHGAASRVGRLRAYGNAINSAAAQVFIESVM